ncbi:hypothetical protein NMY22_g13444 [Coprinellus aureogranulatus]|nr:hypothetical protein NMY22_g13444 [Coprinellus aureogranulatus]
MITLYDFDSALPGKAMSPFGWRVRFALNIKGIEHKTAWLNYGKLEDQLKELNIEPTKVLPDGTPFYTVPAIHDSSTDITISDSHRILEYLDKARRPLEVCFGHMWLPPLTLMLKGMWGLVAPAIIAGLYEAGASKYKERFEEKSGLTLDSVFEDSKKQELLDIARANFSEVDAKLEEIKKKYGGDGPWLLGTEVKLPDLAVAGSLAWILAIVGEDGELWKEVMKWDNGRRAVSAGSLLPTSESLPFRRDLGPPQTSPISPNRQLARKQDCVDMITLYDFDSNLPGRALSPDKPFTDRFALNIKGLEHKTEWLNFAKIDQQLKELNVPPSKIQPDGTPFYSVPAIYDPSTNTTISDSYRILKYLDETYPDTPQLCSHPDALTDDLIKPIFEPDWFLPISLMFHGIWGLVVPNIVNLASDEASGEKYRQKFLLRTGMTVDSVQDPGKKRELLEKGRQNFTEVNAALEEIRKEYGGEGPWLLGKDIKLPDLAIAGSLAWIASIMGEDSDLWRDIREWDDGKWAQFWDSMKPYHKLY